jgi:hypothetical protein
MHPGVWYYQPWMVHHRLIIKNNIQIQESRSKPNGIGRSAGMMLNGFKPVKQEKGLQGGFQFDHIIYKPVLISVIDRFGLVNRGLLNQPGGLIAEQLSNPQAAILKLVAQVGSDTYIGCMKFRHIETPSFIPAGFSNKTACCVWFLFGDA